MRHVCIKCGIIWLPEDDVWLSKDQTDSSKDVVTSDLCEECMTYWIRGKQRTEGFHDCYRRAADVCSIGKECKWFQKCCEELLIEDMLKENENGEDVRT